MNTSALEPATDESNTQPSLQPLIALIESDLRYWREQHTILVDQLNQVEYKIAFTEGKLAGIDECIIALGLSQTPTVQQVVSFTAPYKTAKSS